MRSRWAPKCGSQGSPRLSPRAQLALTALSDPLQLSSSPRDPTPCASGIQSSGSIVQWPCGCQGHRREPTPCMPGRLIDVEQTGLDRVVEPGADEAQATSLGRFSGRRPWSVIGSPPGKGIPALAMTSFVPGRGGSENVRFPRKTNFPFSSVDAIPMQRIPSSAYGSTCSTTPALIFAWLWQQAATKWGAPFFTLKGASGDEFS